MKKRWIFSLMAVALVTLLATGCGTNQTTADSSTSDAKEFKFADPIKLVITHGVGGTVDTAARNIAPYLSKELGVAVVPENKEGSGGRIARAEVFKAKADGCTILMTGMPSLQLGELLFDGNYKTTDFTYIGNVTGGDSGVIFVNASSPVKSIDDLKKLGEEGKCSIATGGGFGSSDQLLSMMLRKTANIPHKFVPYGGDGEAVTAVLGNQVTAGFSSLSLVERFKDQVRVLAVYANDRVPSWPDAPTFKELGYADMLSDSEIGIVAPPGLPAEVAKVLSDALEKANADPEFLAWAKKSNTGLKPLNAEDYKKEALFVYDQLNKYLPDLKAEIANQKQ